MNIICVSRKVFCPDSPKSVNPGSALRVPFEQRKH